MWIFVVIGAVVIGVVAYNYGRGKRASDELDRELELKSDAISTPPLLPPNVIGQSHLEYPSEPGGSTIPPPLGGVRAMGQQVYGWPSLKRRRASRILKF